MSADQERMRMFAWRAAVAAVLGLAAVALGYGLVSQFYDGDHWPSDNSLVNFLGDGGAYLAYAGIATLAVSVPLGIVFWARSGPPRRSPPGG
jgi:hypothetical protein